MIADILTLDRVLVNGSVLEFSLLVVCVHLMFDNLRKRKLLNSVINTTQSLYFNNQQLFERAHYCQLKWEEKIEEKQQNLNQNST